jgi:hypothetical protein
MRPLTKILAWTLVAVVCGFISGIVLSEWIGIVGVVVFHHVMGIKFLPVYVAVASGAVTLTVNLMVRHGRDESAHQHHNHQSSLDRSV